MYKYTYIYSHAHTLTHLLTNTHTHNCRSYGEKIIFCTTNSRVFTPLTTLHQKNTLMQWREGERGRMI